MQLSTPILESTVRGKSVCISDFGAVAPRTSSAPQPVRESLNPQLRPSLCPGPSSNARHYGTVGGRAGVAVIRCVPLASLTTMATQAVVARSDWIGLITVLRPSGTARRELLAVHRDRRPCRLSGSSARVQDVSRCTIAASDHGCKWGVHRGFIYRGPTWRKVGYICVRITLHIYSPFDILVPRTHGPAA